MVSSQARLAVFGVALHALLIYAMFDVHFLTPLVHGMEPTTADFAAPASRLVVIVADGLRADRLFELEDAPGDDPDAPRVPRAPFLHGVAESRGRWGISHARPPTESRPGHVALLAGFYEDPSAITKGWQANAVEFDHLLNQSSAAWALGAPSVVPLFAKGIQHVRHRMYAEELEDFAASNDHAALDEWVFDRTIEILEGHSLSAEDEANGRSRDTERAALEGERVVFLLHLLGLDSAGHAHKPFGDAYAQNVKTVDDGVRRLVDAFERRFDQTPRDGGTTFLFTADHGMSSRGAHGDGDPGCTETPFVAWGAGIPAAADAAADDACAPRGKDAPTPRDAWGLEDKERCDVDQADVASLGASVLGMPPPTHNAGSLPVSYLDPAIPSARSGAALANAEQLLAVYRRKAAVAARASLTAFATPGGLRPYAPLAGANETLAAAKHARVEGDHDAAVDAARALARACVDGATYLHLYDRRLLLWTIASCFLGWIGVLLAELATEGRETKRQVCRVTHTRATAIAVGVSCAACAVLASRRAPATYYAYFTLPAWFARRAFLAFASAAPKRHATPRSRGKKAAELVATAAAATVLARTLCAAFHDRRVFSGLFAATAAALVAFAARVTTAKKRRGDAVARAAAVSALAAAAGAGALAPFTLFSVDLEANTTLVVAGVACTALVGLLSHFALRPLDAFGDDPEDAGAGAAGGARRPGYKLLVAQLSLLWCAGLVVWVVDGLQGAKASIPAWLHASAWAIATGAMPLPLLSPPRFVPRFTSVYLAAATAYALFSVSYESLFYAALGFASLAWLVLERHVQKLAAADALAAGDPAPASAKPTANEVVFAASSELRAADASVARHAATFLALINAAFFGTGNIASVASFEISSVYRFTTRFNPFLMGALLMLKVLVPMITVATAFLCLLKTRAIPPFPAYLTFIALSDLMSVTFFFEVTTEGSWQDIGMSISRYALMGTQVVTILVFLGLAETYAAALPVRGVVARRAGKASGKKTR